MIFLADFYVLDMGRNGTKSSVMLFGCPFMKIARTRIDYDTSALTYEFDRETMLFNIFKAMKHPNDIEIVESIDHIEPLVE